MKGLLALVLLALVAPNAFAERWILKNPQGPLATAHAIRSFELGGDQYVVVDTPRFSGLLATLSETSDSALPDPKIYLPVQPMAEGTSDDPSDDGSKAWHPEKMKYGQLPADMDGRGVIVAVLDTGVDYTHNALKDHVWTNEKEIAGNSIDDDGNGLVDDVHGWDFSSDDSDPIDGDEHGTHCAGIIGATANLKSGAMGVAPGAKIMPVRIIGDEQTGFLSDAVAGIKYAVDNGARVLSNSWRVYKSWSNFDPSDQNAEMLRQAILYAGEHGAIFVAAAGNESKNLDTNTDPMYPGGFTGLANMVVVAASSRDDSAAYFSNYGVDHVQVAAPGNDILSTVPGNRWETMSGTSMAAPLVAGTLARGLSATFTATEAVDRLLSTSTTFDSWKTKVRAGGVIQPLLYLSR